MSDDERKEWELLRTIPTETDIISFLQLINENEAVSTAQKSTLQRIIYHRSRLSETVSNLEKELRAVYRMLEDRSKDMNRCPVHPKGERCCLRIGHEGKHLWAGGD